jgi:glutamate N-acetyltransferase/amino-acid N-acetyltransferase
MSMTSSTDTSRRKTSSLEAATLQTVAEASLPLGYTFAATYAGIRKKQADDLALMVSSVPAVAAAVFTRNTVRAAPLIVTEEHIRKTGGICSVIVANAGNANCATPNGLEVARATARAAAKLARVPREQIFLSSTGVIGEPLDENLILQALPRVWDKLSPQWFEAAARAIMTTDTRPKMAFAEVETKRGVVRIAGMAKGSGMIHPNMATMLSFIFTDAAMEAGVLKKLLRTAVDASFNRISVDSDMSTNDTAYLLANGASGIQLRKKERTAFENALRQVTEKLAIDIVRDGEGARKLLTIEVEGTSDSSGAVRLARAIANSPLVKTALAGSDPNWGRILSSAGSSGVPFDPSKVDVYLNGFQVCRRGLRCDFSEPEVRTSLQGSESTLQFRIRGGGKGSARFWTCDFTEDYIRINAEYRT